MALSTPSRVLGYCVGVVGLLVGGLTIAQRLLSPWPLEWMEGASLQHALRLWQGEPVYGAPTAEFVPYLYPPLAYLPMAFALALLGPELWVGRLVSVLAFAGSLECVRRLAARGGEPALGAWAVGLYALGFGYTGAFVDLVRVDAVFMLLVLLGLERLSAGAPGPGLAWLVLSCFAKQHGLLFLGAGWLSLGAAAVSARAGLRAEAGLAEFREASAASDRAPVPSSSFSSGLRSSRAGWADARIRSIVGSAVALLLLAAALQWVSDGWFLRYTWAVPAGHGLVAHLLVTYLAVDVLVYLPVLAVAVGWWLIRGDPGSRLEWALWLAAALAASALGRAHPGGDDNVRLPGFALLVVLGVRAYYALSVRARPRMRRVATAALGLQALWLLQLPAAHAPPRGAERTFEALHESLRRCAAEEGGAPVALDHALLTGRPFVHTMALSDLRLSEDEELTARAREALLEALAGERAPRSLAVSVTFSELERALGDRYDLCERVPGFRLATGYAIGETRVYRLRAAGR